MRLCGWGEEGGKERKIEGDREGYVSERYGDGSRVVARESSHMRMLLALE